MTGLLSSKFLELHTTWQGMTALSIAQQNGHKKIKEMILVREGPRAYSVVQGTPCCAGVAPDHSPSVV